MRKSFIILLFLSTAVLAHAQDITGIWQGHFRAAPLSPRSSMMDEIRYKFEVQIAQHAKTFEAVTYSYLSTLFYGKAAASGTINPKTGKVLLQEGKLIEFRDQMGGGICIMTCFLQYSKSGDEEFLEGTYVSMSVQDSSNCGRGTVFLRRVTHSDFYKEPFVAKREEETGKNKNTTAPAKTNPNTAGTPVNPPPAKPGTAKSSTNPSAKLPANPSGKPLAARPSTNPPAAKPAGKAPSVPPRTPLMAKAAPSPVQLATTNGPDSGRNNPGRKFAVITPQVLRSRSNELVKTITVNTGEIELNIYDDGAIDHDTISVYLDKKQVISHAMLTDRPIVLTIHMDESSNYHELVMVAENEGDIPPNTSLMIVKAGDKQYEVRITSTEQKNAVIIFKYEKPG